MGYPTSGLPGWTTNESRWAEHEGGVRGAVAQNGGWNMKTVEEVWKLGRRLFQDKMLAVRDIQRDIVKWSQQTFSEFSDVYTLENLMHGRIGDQIKKIDRTLLAPLRDSIADTGLTTKEIEDYLYAKHAPVRNARIAKIDPSSKAGSGMTDAEAAQIMASFSPETLKLLRSIEPKVRAIIDYTRKRMYDGGLITKEAYDALVQDPTYVPLRGEEGGIQVGEDRLSGAGQGLDTRGQEVKRALGRFTKATNILGEVISDARRSAIRSEKNRVGQSLLRLALEFPNPKVWKLEKVKTVRKLSDKTGMLSEAVVDDSQDEATFFVKVDGQPYTLTLEHASLRRAMKNLGVEQMSKTMAFLSRINRWLSAVFTSANANFAPIRCATSCRPR
jgi:hypothetical protein